MASADQSPVKGAVAGAQASSTQIDFLPDADEIERLPLPLVARLTLHLLLAALAGFLLWAYVSEVDVIVTAKGRLVTPLPNIVVQSTETSTIQTIDVRVGQVVRKGQQLASLDPTYSEADEAQLQTRLDSLERQLAELDGALAGKGVPSIALASGDSTIQSRLSTERLSGYDSEQRKQSEGVARLRSAILTAQHDERAMADRVRVLTQLETMTADLVDKKLAVSSRLLEVRDRLLEAERGRDMAQSRQVELNRELSGIVAEKAAWSAGWRQKILEELLSVSRERDAVKDQLAKASRRHSLVVLTAPADAVVLDSGKLSVGSVVREAEPFFTLVPLGDVLEADVQIDATDIGYLHHKEKASIKLDAFPFQKHGTLEGHLTTVSQDAFHREPGSGAGAENYYRARLSLAGSHLKNLPSDTKMLPGMTLTAEMVVGKRSVMSYLIWPLTKGFGEAIREP